MCSTVYKKSSDKKIDPNDMKVLLSSLEPQIQRVENMKRINFFFSFLTGAVIAALSYFLLKMNPYLAIGLGLLYLVADSLLLGRLNKNRVARSLKRLYAQKVTGPILDKYSKLAGGNQ